VLGTLAAVASLKAKVTGGSPSLTRDKLVELSADAWTCDSQRAAEELGFSPAFSLERGMRETLEWFRRQDRS
jgi:nucleoside-diphosphate-sugar epimerase